MNDLTKDKGWVRWYPLTYPGYYTSEMMRVHSFCHECCRLDLSRFRGQTIGLQAVSEEEESLCTLTDEEGKILTQWRTAPETLLVPQNALYLYLNNDYAKSSDFHLLVPEKLLSAPKGTLFDYDFTDPSSLDGNDFFGPSPAKDSTEKGLALPQGIENALLLNQSTAMDDWSITAEITAPLGTEIVCLGTRSTQERNCPHASLCRLDLLADELILYRAGKGKAIPEEILQRAPLGGRMKGELILRMERVNQAIRAVVKNLADGEEISVTEEMMTVENPPSSVAGASRAGKMYDSPQVFALAGKPFLRKLRGDANTSPKVVFFGDSITQGAHNLPRDAWAQKCAADIGNSVCCGRGSGDIWSCLNQVRTLIPVFRPKAMVVTIGTNNLENKVSTETVRGLYEKLMAMADYWGVKLILNCIPVCSRSHIEKTNEILRSFDGFKSRFDLALTKDHTEGGEANPDCFVADQVHLNQKGNRLLYEMFMKDFPWLREL